MQNDFLCPKCNNPLNVDKHVVFATERTDGLRGLLLLSSELGNYSIQTNPEYFIEEGERLEIYCPLCQARLNVHYHSNLARVNMRDENGVISQVIFSRIVGEKSTYIIQDGKVEPIGFQSSIYLDALM